MRRILLLALLGLFALEVRSQSNDEQCNYVFHFVSGDDMLYAPYSNNDVTLDAIIEQIEQYRSLIDERYAYISVMSYGTSGNSESNAVMVAHTQRNRVKSELISRAGITEKAFATDRYHSEGYGDEKLRNVVVVTFPTSTDRVREILGDNQADRIEQYYDEIKAKESLAEEELKASRERFEAERLAKVEELERRIAEQEQALRDAQEARERAEQEALRLAELQETEQEIKRFSVRTNLVRIATLTEDLGVEWRISDNWAVLAHGTFANFRWDGQNRSYAMWQVSPEVRYYFGKDHQWYGGLAYQIGEFDYKFNEVGYQSTSTYNSFGIVAGYYLPLSPTLGFDFGIGVGYSSAPLERYYVESSSRVHIDRVNKGYFGLNQLSATFCWKLF